MPKKTLTYEAAGVPHLKGDPIYNHRIVSLIQSTHIPGVTGNKTGFAALFDFKKLGFRDPLMVSSTDGVGTKLEIARFQKKHDTIGIDLVAMCVNDLVTYGAKPLFFLDYFASGRFDAKVTFEVLKGIVKGCREAGCALIGGETAIMPGFYRMFRSTTPEYDVAGFNVGLVERKKIVTGKTIKKGDVILGLASSGFHSNGYSLIRKVFSKKQLKGPIGKKLLTPTKIYVKPILNLVRQVPVKGIVNITGGGLVDNLPRVIPSRLGALIHKQSWHVPKLFQLVKDSGNIASFEMYRTFNMGIGMAVVVDERYTAAAIKALKKQKIAGYDIGRVVGEPGVDLI